MTSKFVSERVFIKNARLSYPALDEPKSDFGNDPKFQATFLVPEGSETAKELSVAVRRVATEFFGDSAKTVMVGNANPLHRGSEKNPVPDGYEGMIYLKAKSKNRPKLVGAKPSKNYTEPLEIREAFKPGNYVNAYITLFAYDKGSRGVAATLDAVQFRSVGDPLTGAASFDFPDESGASADGLGFEEEDTPF